MGDPRQAELRLGFGWAVTQGRRTDEPFGPRPGRAEGPNAGPSGACPSGEPTAVQPRFSVIGEPSSAPTSARKTSP